MVIEKIRETVVPPEVEKKLQEPQKWQVVYHQPTGIISMCGVCVLMAAFNMKANQAWQHVVNAARSGSEIILAGITKEIALQKANDGEEAAKIRSTCGIVRGMFFTAETQP